jgi:hypothetical protein
MWWGRNVASKMDSLVIKQGAEVAKVPKYPTLLMMSQRKSRLISGSVLRDPFIPWLNRLL